MSNKKRNIVLVGMPGSGKSTLGVLLAKTLVKKFCDTDILIQDITNESLQDTINRDGYMKLRGIEEEALLSVNFNDTVIATGGSAVYSDKGMVHLKKFSTIIYIDVKVEELLHRIPDMESRGIAMKPGQCFKDLYQERCLLYTKYADLTISTDKKTVEESIKDILKQL